MEKKELDGVITKNLTHREKASTKGLNLLECLLHHFDSEFVPALFFLFFFSPTFRLFHKRSGARRGFGLQQKKTCQQRWASFTGD